jgi:hypothetical protein
MAGLGEDRVVETDRDAAQHGEDHDPDVAGQPDAHERHHGGERGGPDGQGLAEDLAILWRRA